MSLVFYSRVPLRPPPWMDPVEFHFGQRISPDVACMFVSPRRPPGGVLLRRKRLIKKHRKWVKAETERLERNCRAAAQAVNNIFGKMCAESSFVRQIMGQGDRL